MTGHFPAGDPATHVRSLPYARALGLRWQQPAAAGQACLRLPYSANVRAADREDIDTAALLGLLDQSCSAAVYVSLPQPALIATLDLRVEFADAVDAQDDVVCTATTTHQDNGAALVRAEAVSARSGRLVALASSAYAIGAHPGQRSGAPMVMADADLLQAIEGETHAGFAQLLGLQHEGDAWALPYDRRLVGAMSLPALHGGATAAALAAAAMAQVRPPDGAAPPKLLTFSVRYLRAATASALQIRTTEHKRGARAAFIGVEAAQGTPPKSVALAECLFVGQAPTPPQDAST